MNLKGRVWCCLAGAVLLLVIYRNSQQRHTGKRDNVISDWWIQPNYYKFGDSVELIVNKVESDLTQLPFAYYDLPFTCPPTQYKKPLHLSLNEIIRGDRKWQSDYILKFGEDNSCQTLCSRKTTAKGIQEAKKLVEQGYVVQWLIDDELPAATTFISTIDEKKYYASGYPLGFVDEITGKAYLNNHVMLVIRYNPVDADRSTIVGFEVYPRSVSDFGCPGASKDHKHYELIVPEDKDDLTFIPVTYSVYWREEYNVNWENRWNFFLNSGELSEDSSKKFHWMSLANSVGILLLITFTTVINLIKVLKKGDSEADLMDISLDNIENNDSIYIIAKDWLLETDGSSLWVKILTIFTAMGVQVFFTIFGSLTISCSLNKLHNIRNSVFTLALLCFVAGAFAASSIGTWLNLSLQEFSSTNDIGYRGASHYNTIFALLCGSALPGLVMISTLILNSVIWAKDSTHALPFGTVAQFISIYFIICIPLSYFGGIATTKIYRSNKQRFTLIKMSPIRMENLLKQKKPMIYKMSESDTKPMKSQLKSYLGIILSGGIPPFIVIYVELQYVYKSLWLEKTTFYYFYGFLLANIALLCILVCEISLLGCFVFMKLAKSSKKHQKDNWRWKCFITGTSCAWYMELYSLYYIFRILRIRGFSSIFISVCYSAIFNITCGLAMGSLGYLACCWFVNRVYIVKYEKK
ncbi:hypothetical protein HG535_0E04420 [Zygotorulaspora mrakii]|uniref:Transmembrane 9 superfamily member n=1 Tax=Zygotorulaspora mrakii TaxID=42260 RepID=A0A7H9B3X6_ZYGMR|nr:uncharacterized protein HG535_0E04420 [Zygotorulaspora mrakii]QLG73358.1 hypothetical protein HG535_0E04420 [Zygotorulaspora mrakii]